MLAYGLLKGRFERLFSIATWNMEHGTWNKKATGGPVAKLVF